MTIAIGITTGMTIETAVIITTIASIGIGIRMTVTTMAGGETTIAEASTLPF
jgi:hypothetical protein